MKRLATIVLFIHFITLNSSTHSQPTYEEVSFVNFGRTKFKGDYEFSESFKIPNLSLNLTYIGNMYFMMDISSVPHLGLMLISKHELRSVENEETGNSGIDMAYGSFAVGDCYSGDTYRFGLGLTLDIRWNELRCYIGNEFRTQEMAVFSLMGNSIFLKEINDKFYNLLSIQVGPTFTNRGATAIDGWQYFIKNSISFGNDRIGVSISPELRIYRTKSNLDYLWKSNSLLIHLGVSRNF